MIIIKSPQEIEKMRASCEIAVDVMNVLESMLEPGVRASELDRQAAAIIRDKGARSAFKGYRGYPANICVSVNEEVVHGIPRDKKLEEGDIVSIDVGVEFCGYFGDMARTYKIGNVNGEKARLVEVTRLALSDAVEMARPERRLYDISHAIESRAVSNGFSVVRDYVGHGIGARLHEAPQIPNFGKPGTGPRLKPGMTFAVEAMINMGSSDVRTMPDGWTVVTEDMRPSAHFEDTIVVTAEGPEVLTCQRRKKR